MIVEPIALFETGIWRIYERNETVSRKTYEDASKTG